MGMSFPPMVLQLSYVIRIVQVCKCQLEHVWQAHLQVSAGCLIALEPRLVVPKVLVGKI